MKHLRTLLHNESIQSHPYISSSYVSGTSPSTHLWPEIRDHTTNFNYIVLNYPLTKPFYYKNTSTKI